MYRKESDNDSLFKADRRIFLNHFRYCRICNELVPRHERSIDHIIPMWQYEGKYWYKENWQMLDKKCHATKTKLEGQP